MEERVIKRLVYDNWNLHLRNLQILREKYGRITWAASSNKGNAVIKMTQIDNEKSILLHSILGNMGICPPVWKTGKDKLYVKVPKGLIFITPFIPRTVGRDVKRFISLVGLFHKNVHLPTFFQSREQTSLRLTSASWIEFYQKRRQKLHQWAKAANNEKVSKAYETSLGVADEATQEIAKQKLEWYLDWSYVSGTFIHGDLHGNNVIFSENKDYILDLDTAQFGPQAFDFHKLIPLVYRWNRKMSINSVLELYFLSYPEAKRFFDIYKAIAMFPHSFFRKARRSMDDQELIEIAAAERGKLELLMKMKVGG